MSLIISEYECVLNIVSLSLDVHIERKARRMHSVCVSLSLYETVTFLQQPASLDPNSPIVALIAVYLFKAAATLCKGQLQLD